MTMLYLALFSFLVAGLIFLAGVLVGQVILRLKLARLERENLALEGKRMSELKELVQARGQTRHRRRRSSPGAPAGDFDQSVRNEIEDLLGDIEKG